MPNKLFSLILVATISIFSVSCGAISIQAQPGYYPPFIKAAQQGNIAEAEKLLKTGVLVDEKTIGNQTALFLAAAEGQDAMVKWLLSHEADPTAQDQNGKTPADFAKSQGHSQTAQLILDYIQLIKNEEQAVTAGDTNSLRKLLSQDGRGYTILHLAAQNGATPVVADEIKSGADVNTQTANGFTALHKSVISGKIEICQLLLNAGANVNARDIYNNTPLYYAILYKNKEMVKLFLDSGADPSIRSVWRDESSIDFAKRLGNAEIVALLEKK
jgi:ankyrin repeat protein